ASYVFRMRIRETKADIVIIDPETMKRRFEFMCIDNNPAVMKFPNGYVTDPRALINIRTRPCIPWRLPLDSKLFYKSWSKKRLVP
ncbi:hypothetical protein AAULR_24511, partial [Lacticaseibacillus rhamnosus MTCC 5462]